MVCFRISLMFLQYGGGISFLFSSFSIYIYYDSLIFLKNLIKKYFLPLLHVMQNKLPLLMKSYIDQNKGLSCWLNHKLKTSLANFFNDQVNENTVYKISNCYCVKSVQIRSFLWSVLSRICTEYGEIRSISPYSVRMRENRDQKNLRI